MKMFSIKTAALMIGAAGMLCLASCQKQEGGVAQFSATIDNPSTSQDKTSIAIVEDLGVISWQAGDAIAVYDNAGTMAELTTTGCGTGADCSEGHDFYIYLPANTYTGMTITLKATDGSICVKTLNVNSWTLAPSTYYSLNFNEEKDGIDQEHWLYRLPVRLTQNFNW